MVLMWIMTRYISATMNNVLLVTSYSIIQTFHESSFIYKRGKSQSFQCKK